MKFLILFLISFNLWASYLPDTKIGEDTTGMDIHSRRLGCETQYSEPCVEFSSNESYKKVIQEVWLQESVQTCFDDSDCDARLMLLSCTKAGYYAKKDYGLLQVYCEKFIPKHVGDDDALKSLYDAKKASDAIIKNALNSQLGDMKFGKTLYAKVMLMNKAKGLTKGQRKALRSNLSTIRDDFFDGDLCGARSDMSTLVADGILITTQNIVDVLALIDAYKTCP